jgi:hypothetical protein
MEHESAYPDTSVRHERLLTTLEGLLTIQATDVKSALNQA